MPDHLMPEACALVSPESSWLTRLSAPQVMGPEGVTAAEPALQPACIFFFQMSIACCEGSGGDEVRYTFTYNEDKCLGRVRGIKECAQDVESDDD